MTAPMHSTHMQTWTPTLRAAGIAGTPTGLSLRQFKTTAPYNLRGQEMTTHAVAGEVPDMDKRNTMNLLLLGAASLPVATLGLPYAFFFVPKSAGGGSGGLIAKDALGNEVTVQQWIKDHPPPTRSLAQGL